MDDAQHELDNMVADSNLDLRFAAVSFEPPTMSVRLWSENDPTFMIHRDGEFWRLSRFAGASGTVVSLKPMIRWMDFQWWMCLVDRELTNLTGFGSLDFPDVDYWDNWDGGTTPADMAQIVIEES